MRQKKRIHVSHIPNTFNYGSAMMAIVLIHRLNGLLEKGVEFYTDVSTPEDLGRLRASTGLDNIYMLPPFEGGFTRPPEWKTMPKWRKCFYIPALLRGWKRKQDHLIKNSDVEILLGGDDLSEYYGKLSIAFELGRLWYISRKIPLFLPGQTIGRFTSYRKKWASFCLKRTRIFTRDDPARDYCVNELGLKNVASSRDLAFLDLPFQNDENERSRIMSKYDLVPGKYVTVVGSGLTAHYTSQREDFINNFSEILNIASGNKEEGKIVFLAHVLRPGHGEDRPVIKDVISALKARNLENVLRRLVVIKDELLPYEARLILGNGRWTVTGRMHAAISTFQMGKPAISLSYSEKYDGVLAKGMDLPELVVDAQGSEKWEGLKISREVGERIGLVESKYDEITERVEKGSARCRDLAFEQIKKIASVISRVK